MRGSGIPFKMVSWMFGIGPSISIPEAQPLISRNKLIILIKREIISFNMQVVSCFHLCFAFGCDSSGDDNAAFTSEMSRFCPVCYSALSSISPKCKLLFLPHSVRSGIRSLSCAENDKSF